MLLQRWNDLQYVLLLTKQVYSNSGLLLPKWNDLHPVLLFETWNGIYCVIVRKMKIIFALYCCYKDEIMLTLCYCYTDTGKMIFSVLLIHRWNEIHSCMLVMHPLVGCWLLFELFGPSFVNLSVLFGTSAANAGPTLQIPAARGLLRVRPILDVVTVEQMGGVELGGGVYQVTDRPTPDVQATG